MLLDAISVVLGLLNYAKAWEAWLLAFFWFNPSQFLGFAQETKTTFKKHIEPLFIEMPFWKAQKKTTKLTKHHLKQTQTVSFHLWPTPNALLTSAALSQRQMQLLLNLAQLCRCNRWKKNKLKDPGFKRTFLEDIYKRTGAMQLFL